MTCSTEPQSTDSLLATENVYEEDESEDLMEEKDPSYQNTIAYESMNESRMYETVTAVQEPREPNFIEKFFQENVLAKI